MGIPRRWKLAVTAAVTLLLAAALFGAVRYATAGKNLSSVGVVYVGKSPAAHPNVRVRAGAWCGTDSSSTDRVPDAAAGAQTHVIYAFPSDGTDRFATMAPGIVADLTFVDGWWRAQDPTRAPRFDLFAFPGCAAGLGQLDLTRVQLSRPSSYYSPSSSRFSNLVYELDSTFADRFKKYLVYFDGAVDDPRLCGQSTVRPDTGGAFAYSIVYTQACRPDVGSGVVTASVAAHELIHNLGAVPPGGPPHACPGDSGHVCDNENDVVFPYTRGQGLQAISLDLGRDDYYAHSGTWWDLQDSAWLAHPGAQFPLTVSVSGSGKVTSALPGVACPPACSATWDAGTQVELSSEPGDGARFLGWSGACSSDPCRVTMSQAQTVVAKFASYAQVSVTVRKVGKGNGQVVSTPDGIICPGACNATFDKGAKVRLAATATKNSAFTGWTGGCSGKGACIVSAGTSSAVTATFAPAQGFVPPKAIPKCKAGQRSTKKKPCRK